MKIGIYGGTFDPPHIGHLNAADTAREQLGLDKLIMIPAGIPPHKMLQNNSASGEDRFNMTALAAEYIGGAEVTDMELRRGGKSYTIDTLFELKKQYPDDELYLFIGTDMLEMFEQWHRFEEIFPLCTLAVFARREDDHKLISSESARLSGLYGARIEIVENSVVDISSTELRAKLAGRDGCRYIPDSVYGYIIEHGLYGARPDFDWLRVQAYKLLKPSRVPHVAGCEYEAARLAKRWGADEDSAREAAILHDITKKLELEAQLILCDKYGIIIDNAERSDAKLLHAKTGAGLAGDMFGISEEVYSAIYWHTTGRADMSLLEKIIYLADYIEPTRDFDGLTELRRESYRDLDRAVVLGLEMSLEDLRERGITPHGRTCEAIDWFRRQEREQI